MCVHDLRGPCVALVNSLEHVSSNLKLVVKEATDGSADRNMDPNQIDSGGAGPGDINQLMDKVMECKMKLEQLEREHKAMLQPQPQAEDDSEPNDVDEGFDDRMNHPA